MYNKWFINGEYTFTCEIFKKQKQKNNVEFFLGKKHYNCQKHTCATHITVMLKEQL